MLRGCSWAWPSIVLIGVLAAPAWAQPPGSSKKSDEPGTSKKAAEDTSKKEATKKEAAADEEAVEQPEKKPANIEVFEDPNAAKANGQFSPLPSVAMNPRQLKEVRAMAGGGTPEKDLIDKYVKYYAAQLTNKAAINALIEVGANPPPPPGGAAARGIREASAGLTDPIQTARRANNTAFLTMYTRALLGEAPKLLRNHLVARIEAMIALAQTGHQEALDTFIKQLDDKDQTIWVKLWAARGITNIVQTPTGFQELQGGTAAAVRAAKALISFLSQDDLPWPAQLRALEALGALRLAADPTAQTKVEMATAALERLSNPDARLEVRAQAGWALGMLRISTANGKVNFPLIAYYVGEVAADLGERVAASYATNMTQARYWTAPLLYQIWPALNGLSGVRDSGLLHMPSLAPADRTFIDQVNGLVKPVAKSAVELIKSPTGGREKLAKELSDRVGALKTFLDKNQPSDTKLVPTGKPFPLQAQMAGDTVGRGRVVGAAAK